MKKIATIVALILLLASCSGGSGGKEVRLEEATDSVAYVMGMNIGLNLIRMDSTLNIDAVCQGIRNAAARRTVMTIEEAEAFYLRHINYELPERARAYEEQLLADMANRSRYARTKSGVTYTVDEVGDQGYLPNSQRDSLRLRLRIYSTDEKEFYSSYEQGDTLTVALGDLVPGVQECVRMVGAGGKMTAWIPSHEAYGAEGDPSKKIGPNTTLGYDIEVVDVVKYADWVNERRSWKD